MLQNPLIVICSRGPSGLIFALSLYEILVKKNLLGKILIYHEHYKTHNTKNRLFLVNEEEFSRLPQSVRKHIYHTSVFEGIFSGQENAYFMNEFEDKLLELFAKLNENVQLVHERFDPSRTDRYDLLVLADDYDSYQFEKEAISKCYQLEIKFHVSENQLQNGETEALSLLQTRYWLQFQQDNQSLLKVNLSKSEYESIEFDPSLDSIKNNPWFMNVIRDGFEFFEVHNYDLVSISKNSDDDLLVTKEFYKNYKEGFVCVIGDAAFNCAFWQSTRKLDIAISTAITLAEQLTYGQTLFEITRENLDRFSNAMVYVRQDLVQQLLLTNMENIIFKVIYGIIDKYNKKCSSGQEKITSSIDSFNFIIILDKYPQLFEIDQTPDDNVVKVLNELREEYTKNVQSSTPVLFLKTLERIQYAMNYFTIFESHLSSHILDNEFYKDDWIELNSSLILRDIDSNENVDTSDTSSEDSDDSSEEETQQDLSLEEFFQITFGDEPINYDVTNFVTDELSEDVFKTEVGTYLKDHTQGILRNIFPYIVDIINRTISLQRIQGCIRQISASDNIDDPSQILKRLTNCKGRDYLVAFLDNVPKSSLTKILLSLTRANIPIPLLFTNNCEFSQKGLKVLREIRSLILRDKYHLLLSFNLSTSESSTPFSKRLYPIICKNREDDLSITSAGSMDVSFHPASENYGRKPVAIAEVYLEEDPNQIFLSLMNGFSKFAFYMFVHVNDRDFEDNSPSNELKLLIETISLDSNNSKISVINWNRPTKNDPFSKRKKNIKKLFKSHFKPERVKIEQISNDLNQFLEDKKFDITKQLSQPDAGFIYPQLILKLETLENKCLNIWLPESLEESFTYSMKQKKFSTHHSDYISEEQINKKIHQFRNDQVNLYFNKPIPILLEFAKIINENKIIEMRKFAGLIDKFFKDHLAELQKSNENNEYAHNKQMIEENDISIHDIWKEFIILSNIKEEKYKKTTVLEKLYDVPPQNLFTAFTTWIIEGEPIQILDGISLKPLPTNFLSYTLCNIMSNTNRKLIIISIIGFESSGKSTLLNYLFQCSFATSATRCTKGLYLSYRNTTFDDNPIDLLILDSEGMNSTAQKYITTRNDFDKKFTLFALMCSHIIIINTKGLTRDIGDILEVSSWHLDGLRNRKSKPRLHFVLRDMNNNAKDFQPFQDIVNSLKKMFQQIPGCAESLEDFMTIQEDDIHLLTSAFHSYSDDFCPTTGRINERYNINVPAETFSNKTSILRHSLLNSATSPNTYFNQFNNIQGFIPYMKTVWDNIGIHGNFLHFEDFRSINAWHQMRYLVNEIKGIDLKGFRNQAKGKIRENIERLEVDHSKWIEVETKVRKDLDELQDEYNNICMKKYDSKLQNQFDLHIFNEGKRLIYNMIAEERMECDTLWLISACEYKDSWLSDCAIKKVGNKIEKLIGNNHLNNLKDIKYDEIFEEIWVEVERDKMLFDKEMILTLEDLKPFISKTFNNAIEECYTKVCQTSEDKEQVKFKRNFFKILKKPATFEEKIQMDTFAIMKVFEIENIAEDSNTKNNNNLKNKFNKFKRNLIGGFTSNKMIEYKTTESTKIEIARSILSKFYNVIKKVKTELEDNNSLRIDSTQAVKCLETLCNFFFDITNDDHNGSFITFKDDDFNIFEKYLRIEIFQSLSNNIDMWNDKQQKTLEGLRQNLIISFEKILSYQSGENISKEFTKYIIQAIRPKVDKIENDITQRCKEYIKKSWNDTRTATTNAFDMSFGKLDLAAVNQYLNDPTQYMFNLMKNEFMGFSDMIIYDKLQEVDEMIKYTQDTLLNDLKEWIELFDEKKNYNEFKLSYLLTYLSGNSHDYEELTHILSTKYGIVLKKKKSSHDFSKILKDVTHLLNSCIVQCPVYSFNTLSKELKEEFQKLYREWNVQEREKVQKILEITVKGLSEILVDKIGCKERCPFCSSKCELPNDGHEKHYVTNHLFPAFSGVCSEHYRHPILYSCTESAVHENVWNYAYLGPEVYSLDEFLKKFHPEWHLFQRSKPNDENIMKMRAVWWKLRQNLCLKNKMIDNTDPSWGSMYESLIPE
ncbi:18637_t:CDS:10 [Funneliformis geosporum]|uniref:1051_t:CDS:1 n=1 Tax=Funneliformis geosporum TaxID=1117311 RepID=A0A9W4WTX4_9GLOM|nr:1051_t:CDS:10 [Funneliformis geosporum]CAI2172600.1 18637_t:CDS:10 [Funneliformis geosporum]